MKKRILDLAIAVVMATSVPVPAEAATSDIGDQIPGGGYGGGGGGAW